QVDRAGDEHDRERVRDRPDHEREVPEEVALGEVDVALDDAAEADQLAAQRRSYCGHPNTSLISSSSVCSSSNVRPVAAKNASSSVWTPYRRLTSATGSRNSSWPRSSSPTRSARASASPMSCVQSRIVASWVRLTSR